MNRLVERSVVGVELHEGSVAATAVSKSMIERKEVG